MVSKSILFLILSIILFLLYFYLKTEKKFKNLILARPVLVQPNEIVTLNEKINNEITERNTEYRNLMTDYQEVYSIVNNLQDDLKNHENVSKQMREDINNRSSSSFESITSLINKNKAEIDSLKEILKNQKTRLDKINPETMMESDIFDM